MSEGIKRIRIKYFTTKTLRKMELFETTLLRGKTQPVSIEQVKAAYQKVKSNGGAGGVDKISISDYEAEKVKGLYKVWNRMAWGSYHPQAVRGVWIPKQDGSKRLLGIPTIEDRIAQQVVKDVLEPRMEKVFLTDSYGYRPNRGAHGAIEVCRERCFKKSYVIDLDIKGFFDNIDHELMMRFMRQNVTEKWVLLYVERWQKAPLSLGKGESQARMKGTPQGGVISPLLANLFLHEVFDKWIREQFPQVEWERYADDIIIHCGKEKEAKEVLSAVKARLEANGLTAHEQKTQIVYCKSGTGRKSYPNNSFDYLGYSFQPRRCVSKAGTLFLGFTPSISEKACKRIRAEVNQYRFHRMTHLELPQIAQLLEAKLQGWIHYYGKFTPSGIGNLLQDWLNRRIAAWVRNKYKSCKGSIKGGISKLKEICKDFPNLFVHWRYGYCP